MGGSFRGNQHNRKAGVIMNGIKLAEQQFTGYTHAKRGYGLIKLVESMGLTKKEWDKVDKIFTGLTGREVKEIDAYFDDK